MFSKVHIHLQLYIFFYIFFSLCYHAALDTFTQRLGEGASRTSGVHFFKTSYGFPEQLLTVR